MPDPAAVCVVTVYLILNLLLNYYSAFLLGGRDDLDGGGERGHLHLPIPIFYSMLNHVAIVIMTSCDLNQLKTAFDNAKSPTLQSLQLRAFC